MRGTWSNRPWINDLLDESNRGLPLIIEQGKRIYTDLPMMKNPAPTEECMKETIHTRRARK
jgi:hypothetical protein